MEKEMLLYGEEMRKLAYVAEDLVLGLYAVAHTMKNDSTIPVDDNDYSTLMHYAEEVASVMNSLGRMVYVGKDQK